MNMITTRSESSNPKHDLELVLLSTGRAEATDRILGVVRRSCPDRRIPLLASLDEFKAWIGHPLTKGRAVVALLAARDDLEALTALAEQLHRVWLILVLPDRDRAIVAAAIGLRPSFYTFIDSDPEEVGLVLGRMFGTTKESPSDPLPDDPAEPLALSESVDPAEPPEPVEPPKPPESERKPEPATGEPREQSEKSRRGVGGKYLTFSLARTEYGIPIMKVREILGLRATTLLPQTPDQVRGVLNLRGKVIPVYDLRRCFGLPRAEDTDRSCIIVTQTESDNEPTSQGIVVDFVSEVKNIMDHEVEGPPALGLGRNRDSILGMAKTEQGVTTLLDVDRILASALAGEPPEGCPKNRHVLTNEMDRWRVQ
jgi:purine-binding chemotaxis protein CheW